jgi:hypothetical protein
MPTSAPWREYSLRCALGSCVFSLLAATAAFAAPANSTLNVRVRNQAGTLLPGAQVVALSFNNGNPDAVVSRVAVTDLTGTANFSSGNGNALTDGKFYQVIGATQGFLPSFVDQFNNGAPGLQAVPSLSTPVITITVSSAGVAVGELDGTVSNATPNSLLFGQVGLQLGGGAAAFGFALTDGAGAATLRVFNVAFASAGTYAISAFDPVKNRSISANITSTLDVANNLLTGTVLNFANSATPVSNVSQTQQSGAAGGLSVDGVIVDTATTPNPIPYLQVSFGAQFQDQYGQMRHDFRGAPTDQNGRFQLYGLLPGVTYYTTIYGMCNAAACYEGSQSTAMAAGFGSAPGVNDFLYTATSTVLRPTIVLKQTVPSNGKIAVYVSDQFGGPFPQSGVSLFPDGAPWMTTGGGACTAAGPPSPGSAHFNVFASSGYASLTGLASGNYQLRAFTPYGESNFNAGADGIFNFGNCTGANAADDRRVTIDTMTTPNVHIYDKFGNQLGAAVSSVTLVVRVSTGSTGMISGSLTFPGVVDLSQSPILITLNPQCLPNQPCTGGGGFKSFNSASTGPVINYSIGVSSGQSYFLNVVSNYWGAVFPGGNQPQPNLIQSSNSVVNMNFFPSGRVLGSLRKPDGSVYVPPSNQQGGGGISVFASGNNSWANGQLASDGSFALTGLLPGRYTMGVQNFGGGSFPYTIKQPAPQVTVIANQDTRQDAYLEGAVFVRPQVSLASLPPLSIYNACPANNFGDKGDCPPERWQVLALPQGTPLNAAVVTPLLVGDNRKPGLFDYSVGVGMATRCSGSGGQYMTQPGFCYGALTAGAAGATYDFYVTRHGGFDSSGLAGGVRPYFVIQNSSKSVVVDSPLASTPVPNFPGSSTTTVQDIQLTPSPSLAALPQAVLTGTITIANFITAQQFTELGGDFSKFLKFLPTIWLYDSTGTLNAMAIAVPYPPRVKAFDDQLNQSVALNDFAQFQSLTDDGPGGWGALGFDIRGLTAARTYALVVTSPNYPPYKASITLGAAGSTTTVIVNLDLNPGSTLSGVVRSTSGVALSGAQVTIKAQGFSGKTLTTDAAGAWSVAGLADGNYQILAVASGYVQQAQSAAISGNSTVVLPAFLLSASNSSISGTVYTNNAICPAGSTGCAAFGRTSIQDATVLAYDDTLNATDPTAVLPLYRAVTDSSGTYTLTGLRTGSLYKVFVNVSGYYVQNQSTLTVAGARTGFDFALKPKPLDVNVFGRPAAPNFEFQITNFQQFSKGSAWIGLSPFVKATSTDVSNNFIQRPDSLGVNQLILSYPLSNLSSGTVHTLHLEAQPNDPRAALVVKDVTFGLNLPRNTCQSIDQALLGDESAVNAQGQPQNQAPIDISGGDSGNGAGISLPAGGVIPILSTSIPSMCMSETNASAAPQVSAAIRTSGITLAAFLSGVYSVQLSSINYTQKGIDLTLSYDKTSADLNDLAIFSFSGGRWKSVPGLQTVDPVLGTISVKGLKNLASVLSVKEGGGNGLMAVNNGNGYSPNVSVAAVDDVGAFAVLRPSQVSGGAFSGTTVRIFNFPNPFNLQTKTVPLNATSLCAGGATSAVTDGTVIKYEIPADVSGAGVIRIYTLAGRLVRELDAGQAAASTCYYTTWDGKNRSGLPVANGVYYGVLSIGGTKQASGTFKLAVIK